ncbi:DUF5703 domain-containing protein [Flavivirga amylovorans]|uniref:DUF5703 domain-containing protein n=1 Tax=Flavivirga amylovorans TaxID=870486 RepID=UPI00349E60FF
MHAFGGWRCWIECLGRKDELLSYVSQSGTFDENNQMLKHDLVRINFSPNPFKKGDSFS